MRYRELHNAESPNSPLKVDYQLNPKNNSMTINTTNEVDRLNQTPNLRINNKRHLPTIKRNVSPIRIDQFNSYSNENMDFFRLDYLSESKSHDKHNIYFDDFKPINRNENYQKINETGEKIKYIDSLKKRQITETNNKINKSLDILNPKMNLNNNKNNFEIQDKYKKNLYANPYLANLNDYSIKEEYNPLYKNQKKEKQRVIFPIILDKCIPYDYVAKENFRNQGRSRFYQNYRKNFEGMGFQKQKGPCAYFDNVNKNKFFFRIDRKKLEPINKNNTDKTNPIV